jgi:hypothetical protein
MPEPVIPNELETDILAVYRGPLEEFVSRRDALVKQLRGAKQRESADHVKTLRKPSRMAWILDNIVHEDSASIEQLAAAINEAQSGPDLRTALETVKAVVRDVATVGARVALRAQQPVELNAIIMAVHAVIGDASAFADWRAGRLVEVPDAGGLDMLTAFTAREQSHRAPSSSIAPPSRQAPKTEPRPETAVQNDALAKAARADALAKTARADLRHAEMSLAKVRERSEHAAGSVLKGEERLDVAERTLLHAQAEAQARRADLERARRDAEAEAAAVQDAERAVAAARARLVEGSEA